MDLQKLIEEARIRYPIGTKFNNSSLLRQEKPDIEITGCEFGRSFDSNDLVVYSNSCKGGVFNGSWSVYRNGRWAEIVESANKTEIINNYAIY